LFVGLGKYFILWDCWPAVARRDQVKACGSSESLWCWQRSQKVDFV